MLSTLLSHFIRVLRNCGYPEFDGNAQPRTAPPMSGPWVFFHALCANATHTNEYVDRSIAENVDVMFMSNLFNFDMTFHRIRHHMRTSQWRPRGIWWVGVPWGGSAVPTEWLWRKTSFRGGAGACYGKPSEFCEYLVGTTQMSGQTTFFKDTLLLGHDGLPTSIQNSINLVNNETLADVSTGGIFGQDVYVGISSFVQVIQNLWTFRYLSPSDAPNFLDLSVSQGQSDYEDIRATLRSGEKKMIV